MLVACVLLNLTSRTQVDTVREELFIAYPTAFDMAQADDDLEEIIRPLGLVTSRADRLRRMSAKYAEHDLTFNTEDLLHRYTVRPTVDQIAEWPGIGPYALDSWDIFITGDITNVNQMRSKDKPLTAYLESKEWSPPK
jgi:endonuclease III